MKETTLKFLQKHQKTLEQNNIKKLKDKIIYCFDGDIEELLDILSSIKLISVEEYDTTLIRYYVALWCEENDLPVDINLLEKEYNYHRPINSYIRAVEYPTKLSLYKFYNPDNSHQRYIINNQNSINTVIEYLKYSCDEGEDIIPDLLTRLY